MRKIIQIVPVVRNEDLVILYALCNDGSVWWKEDDSSVVWKIDTECDELPNVTNVKL